MNDTLSTTLKIVAAVLLILVIAHFWPGLAALAFIGVTTLLALAGSIIAGAIGALGVLIAIGCAILAVLVTLGVALSPIWVPVLAIVGLVAILRSLSRSPARS